MEAFPTFNDALASLGLSDVEELKESPMRIHGTFLEDGKPRYFTAPADIDGEDLHDRAFHIRNGRPFSDAERFYRNTAMKLRGVA